MPNCDENHMTIKLPNINNESDKYEGEVCVNNKNDNLTYAWRCQTHYWKVRTSVVYDHGNWYESHQTNINNLKTHEAEIANGDHKT